MASVGIAVVGIGAVSQSVHLPAIRRLAPALELVGVHDVSPGRSAAVAAAFGTVAFPTFDALLESPDVSAVLIATPGSHADLARRALAAGKHVLAEKPLAHTVQDARELGDLARSTGLILQVGYMKMHDAVADIAAREVGDLDRIELIRATVLHPDNPPQLAHLRMQPFDDVDPEEIARLMSSEEAATERAIGAQPAVLGRLYRDLLNGSVIHELSLLRAIGFTLPEEFTSVELWPDLSERFPPSILAVGPMAQGARLVLSWNWLPHFPDYEEEVALFGDRGRMRLQLAPPYLLEERSSIRIERFRGEERQDATFRAARDSSFVTQLDAFGGAVRGDAPVRPGSDAEGAVQDLRCLQALVRALCARQGWNVGGEAAA